MASAPRAIVEIVSGPLASTKALIAPGATLRVGRTDQADLIVPQDPRLAGLHFELRWDGARCVVRDLGAAGGTRLHGQAVSEAEVPGWSAIEAGETSAMMAPTREAIAVLNEIAQQLRIAAGRHHDPHAVLGVQPRSGGKVVVAYFPAATGVELADGRALILARLGPDPLRRDADPQRYVDRVMRYSGRDDTVRTA